MDANERIRAYLGIAKLKLKNDQGIEDEFIVKSIRMKDMALIVGAMGSLDENHKPTPSEISDLMDVMSTVGKDVIIRSFPHLNDDEVESLLVKNFKSISDCIMSQVKLMSKEDDVNKIRRLTKREGK